MRPTICALAVPLCLLAAGCEEQVTVDEQPTTEPQATFVQPRGGATAETTEAPGSVTAPPTREADVASDAESGRLLARSAGEPPQQGARLTAPPVPGSTASAGTPQAGVPTTQEAVERDPLDIEQARTVEIPDRPMPLGPVELFQGQVLDLRTVGHHGFRGPVAQLLMRTQQGDVIVDLGPTRHLGAVQVQPGAPLTVSGRLDHDQPRPVLYAIKLHLQGGGQQTQP